MPLMSIPIIKPILIRVINEQTPINAHAAFTHIFVPTNKCGKSLNKFHPFIFYCHRKIPTWVLIGVFSVTTLFSCFMYEISRQIKNSQLPTSSIELSSPMKLHWQDSTHPFSSKYSTYSWSGGHPQIGVSGHPHYEKNDRHSKMLPVSSRSSQLSMGHGSLSGSTLQ